MYRKISSMLDKLADNLESKGFIKEASELDKISDDLDGYSGVKLANRITPTEIKQGEEIGKEVANLLYNYITDFKSKLERFNLKDLEDHLKKLYTTNQSFMYSDKKNSQVFKNFLEEIFENTGPMISFNQSVNSIKSGIQGIEYRIQEKYSKQINSELEEQ